MSFPIFRILGYHITFFLLYLVFHLNGSWGLVQRNYRHIKFRLWQRWCRTKRMTDGTCHWRRQIIILIRSLNVNQEFRFLIKKAEKLHCHWKKIKSRWLLPHCASIGRKNTQWILLKSISEPRETTSHWNQGHCTNINAYSLPARNGPRERSDYIFKLYALRDIWKAKVKTVIHS